MRVQLNTDKHIKGDAALAGWVERELKDSATGTTRPALPEDLESERSIFAPGPAAQGTRWGRPRAGTHCFRACRLARSQARPRRL